MAGIANSHQIRTIVFFYDLAMAVMSVFVALLFRLGDLDELDASSLLLGAVLPFTGAAAMSFSILRLYRTSWRHASTADLVTIVQAATLTVFLYLPLSFLTTRLTLIPRSFVLLSWMALILLLAGSRVSYRLYREGRLIFTRKPMTTSQTPILLVGAGSDAELFLRSLDRGGEYYPVGILDDHTRSALLRGVPVLGKIADAEMVVDSFADAGDRPRKLVISNRNLSSETLTQLVEFTHRRGLSIARMPDPQVLKPGVADNAELRPISVEDLLGRPQVVLNTAELQNLIKSKRVLVTGAGGFIGSEIVRQVCAFEPSAVCLLDAAEFGLYTIDLEMSEKWPTIERLTRLVDVRQRSSVDLCFSDFRPDIVFHAAALKHLPLVEQNPIEGAWTNIIGSRHVCDMALKVGARALVMISTDKAVNPTSIMGASKRCAEIYCQSLGLAHASQPSVTRFVAVRFGNVLGSTGSVVPLFERQLKARMPLTVTHPEAHRYFMTVREAVQLVLHASVLGTTQVETQGRVFVLDMGKPIKIVELARQMIRLVGLSPEDGVFIKFTGLRPGEKLTEELSHDVESLKPTSVERINVISPRTMDLETLTRESTALEAACVAGQTEKALRILQKLVPEFAARRTAAE